MTKSASPSMVIVSNGHGEDSIGATLGQALQSLNIAIEALPLVGSGAAYTGAGFKVLGPLKEMPSGGFIHNNLQALWADLKSGLVASSLQHWLTLKRLAQQYWGTLVVGDWYALAVGSLFGKHPLFQHQPAVSVRAWRPQGLPWAQPFGPFERLLMKKVLRIYPREAEAATWLNQHGLKNVQYFGNPMLDAIEGVVELSVPGPYLLLLPGSRSDAYYSLPLMIEACRHLRTTGLTPVVAWANLPLNNLEVAGWGRVSTRASRGLIEYFVHPDGTTVYLAVQSFKTLLRHARLGLSTSGTAAEQTAGYGIPLVGFPTQGPQYTQGFAERQQQLLGDALVLSKAQPHSIALAAQGLLSPPRHQKAQATGRAIMGEPGAARRIASDIYTALLGTQA